MHWDLRQARTFIAVAEALSFSAAARKLHTTQSAISRTVAQMEADLGLPLLHRTTRSVMLTPEGTYLLEECREVVAHFDRWLSRARRIAEGTAGEISVGANDFAIQSEVPRLLNRFRALFPEMEFRFQSLTRETQIAKLESGEIEMGFAMGPVAHPRLKGLCVAEYGLNCLVHVSHPLANRRSVSLLDLQSEQLILGDPDGWKTYGDFLKRAFGAVGLPLRVHQMVSESIAIFGLVAGGTGVTLYPDCQEFVELRGVVKIPVSGLHEKIQTIAIWPDAHLSRAGRLFVDFVCAETGAPKLDRKEFSPD